jgi:hypothetical protein
LNNPPVSVDMLPMATDDRVIPVWSLKAVGGIVELDDGDRVSVDAATADGQSTNVRTSITTTMPNALADLVWCDTRIAIPFPLAEPLDVTEY